MQLSAGYFVRKSEFLVLLHRGEKIHDMGTLPLFPWRQSPPTPIGGKDFAMVFGIF